MMAGITGDICFPQAGLMLESRFVGSSTMRDAIVGRDKPRLPKVLYYGGAHSLEKSALAT